jgi:hypothetical protein
MQQLANGIVSVLIKVQRKFQRQQYRLICPHQGSERNQQKIVPETIPVKTSCTSKPDPISEILITHQQRAIQHGSNIKNQQIKPLPT